MASTLLSGKETAPVANADPRAGKFYFVLRGPEEELRRAFIAQGFLDGIARQRRIAIAVVAVRRRLKDSAGGAFEHAAVFGRFISQFVDFSCLRLLHVRQYRKNVLRPLLAPTFMEQARSIYAFVGCSFT